jgi:ribosomal protein L2
MFDLKKVKATTPGQRMYVRVMNNGLHKGGPKKFLVEKKKK